MIPLMLFAPPHEELADEGVRAFCVSRLSMRGACPGTPMCSLLQIAPTTSCGRACGRQDCS